MNENKNKYGCHKRDACGSGGCLPCLCTIIIPFNKNHLILPIKQKKRVELALNSFSFCFQFSVLPY